MAVTTSTVTERAGVRRRAPAARNPVDWRSEIYLHAIDEFVFSDSAADQAEALLLLPPEQLFHELINDKESEATRLAAKRIVDGVLAGELIPLPRPVAPRESPEQLAGGLATWLNDVRRDTSNTIKQALRASPECRGQLLKERAPVALVAGCWLESVSQPVTQPAVIVNQLFAQYFRDRGAGSPARAAASHYRRELDSVVPRLPTVASAALASALEADTSGYLTACFYLSIGRYPANYFPEVIGLNVAFRAVGIEAETTGAAFSGGAATRKAAAIARRYVDALRASEHPTAPQLLARFEHGVRAGVTLERWQLARVLDRLAAAQRLSLDEQVAKVVERHFRYAGKHHSAVMIAGRPLADMFADPAFDPHEFVRTLKRSPYLSPQPNGENRFSAALRFGGSMFGIFSASEADLLRAWAAATPAETAAPALPPYLERDTADDPQPLAHSTARSVRFTAPGASWDQRELFHRLVNVENYPCVLPLAKQIAEQGLRAAQQLFFRDVPTRYTDPRFFEYSPEAFERRMESIYWEKLVRPYKPLTQIPPKDEVVFGQKNLALGALIDGAWIHRIGLTGRTERDADHIVFEIYADEMGRGDVKKNHLAIIRKVLASMDVHLPPIGDTAFKEQDDFLDELYPYVIFQLSLSLFPDDFFPEILGYNAAIEMFGACELRMHEIQKLQYWGFDVEYELTHLSIDNISAGHTRAAMDAVIGYIEEIRRGAGEDAMRRVWQRVWAGYASFAQYVEKIPAAGEKTSYVI